MPDNLQRFTPAARGILVTAEAEAQNFRHEFVGPEHLLLALVREERGGAARVLQGLFDKERVVVLVGALPSVPWDTAYDKPQLSDATKQVLESAAVEAGHLGYNVIDSEDLLMGLVRQADGTVVEILREFNATPGQIIIRLNTYQHVSELLSNSTISGHKPFSNPVPLLVQLTTDLVAEALAGKLDPVVGRDAELQRMCQILSSHRKRSVLLVGQPGVGKTAIVHGLVRRLIDRTVPDSLQNRRVLLLEPLRLVAGSFRDGQFEERYARVFEELRASTDIILFIDDDFPPVLTGLDRASTLLSLGGTGVPFIHAATTDNFERFLEPNSSLMQTFVALFIEELSPEDTLKALYAHRPIYQEHYGISIDDDAIEAAARLANPYIKTGVQPDKSIQLLDEVASAFVWRQKEQPEQQDKAHLTRADVLIVLSQITGLPIDQLQ